MSGFIRVGSVNIIIISDGKKKIDTQIRRGFGLNLFIINNAIQVYDVRLVYMVKMADLQKNFVFSYNPTQSLL